MSPADYRLYSLKEVDERPELIECSSYHPPPARGAGGRRIAYVSVSFSLSPSGQVTGPMVTRAPRGVPGIRSAALSAARSCRHTPARIDGRAVGVRGLGYTFAFEVCACRTGSRPIRAATALW